MNEHPAQPPRLSAASSSAATCGTTALDLYAPNCPSQWCSVTYHCGGGGSNIGIAAAPTFLVKRRGVAEEVVASSKTEMLPVDAVRQVPWPQEWSSIQITGRFKNGDEDMQRTVTLTPSVPVGTTELWDAKYQNNVLIITTRRRY